MDAKIKEAADRILRRARGENMRVLVEKERLLAVIRENRDKHREVFLKALKGYHNKMLILLGEMVDRIKKGDVADRYIGLPVPSDHTADYDRIISMLEMDVREELEIEERQYQWYVLDDWEWKEQWSTTNTAYLNE